MFKRAKYILKTGRFGSSWRKDCDLFMLGHYIVHIPKGLPYTSIPAIIKPAPITEKNYLSSVNTMRKEVPEFRWHCTRPAEDILYILENFGIVQRGEGFTKPGALKDLFSKLLFEPTIRPDTPDRNLIETFYSKTDKEHFITAMEFEKILHPVPYPERIQRVYDLICKVYDLHRLSGLDAWTKPVGHRISLDYLVHHPWLQDMSEYELVQVLYILLCDNVITTYPIAPPEDFDYEIIDGDIPEYDLTEEIAEYELKLRNRGKR